MVDLYYSSEKKNGRFILFIHSLIYMDRLVTNIFSLVLNCKVHITQGDHVGKAVIVSWVTMDEPGSSQVRYWSELSRRKRGARGTVVTYNFYNYTSGFIHHCTIKDLEVNFWILLSYFLVKTFVHASQ